LNVEYRNNHDAVFKLHSTAATAAQIAIVLTNRAVSVRSLSNLLR
jgi:hypothetical protein